MKIDERIDDLEKSQARLRAEFERPVIHRRALAYLSEIGFPDHADDLATLQGATWAATKSNIDAHFNTTKFRILGAMRRAPSITSGKEK